MNEIKRTIENIIKKLNVYKEEAGCGDGEVVLQKQENGIILLKVRDEVVKYFFDSDDLDNWANADND